MKNFSTLIKSTLFAAATLFTVNASAQAITENFDDITLLAGNGWSLQNLSTPVGSTNWFQGTNVAAGGPFDAYNGAVNAYIGANYNNTGNTGTISNWLMMPNRTLRNGDVITFYTRKVAPDSYADRLEVRMSTNGASTNAGTNATTVGDFTTLVLSVNPSLVLGVYPTVWTQYTITISGLSAPTSGRLAFRYFVTGAGLSGANSDYIGIDAFTYTPYVCPAFTVSPSGLAMGTAGSAYSQTLSSTGPLGVPTYSVTAGALPPGVTCSSSGVISGTPTATGMFNFTITVSDASGCTGSMSYSIMIMCPTGGATMSSIPAQCTNGSPYTLTQGSPAGGTYSGTGVSGGMFDPSVGTQTITYTLIDSYGCTQTANGTATVNTPPTVTLSSFTAVCDNGGMVTLTGESPAGGTFSGTNVSGNMFDPSGGTQTVTYMYTDANVCSGSASQSVPVNTAPTVTYSAPSAVCSNAGMIMLMGESPAGGTWSGTGVTGNQFDPSSGTQTITYMYTDGNGCSNSASQTQTVNTAPAVVANASQTTVCPGSLVTLTGSGATSYTWDNSVMDGVPFTINTTTTYMVTGTDANGCNGTDMITINVNSTIPVVANTTSTSVCTGSSVTLTGSGAVTYTWDNSVVDGVSFVPSSTATYIVTGTDANGCTGTDTVTITVNPLPTVTGTSSANSACTTDANITLTGSPAGGTWSGTGVTGNAFSPSTAGTGTHTLTYDFTDANGCSGSATVTITVNACVGIATNDAAALINVYPNPTEDGNIFITMGDFGIAQGTAEFQLVNVVGQTISVMNTEYTSGQTVHFTTETQLAKGAYLLKVTSNNRTATVRIVVE